jgi:hypothetical protein
MPIPVDALMMLATQELYIKVGPDISKTCEMLLFGGPGVPGIIDDNHLVDAALEQSDTDILPETALAAVTAAAKGSFATKLKSDAMGAISAGSLSDEAVDQVIKFIVADTD